MRKNETRRDRRARQEKEYTVRLLITEATFMMRFHRYDAAVTTINKVRRPVTTINKVNLLVTTINKVRLFAPLVY
jgi:hypothetical protein